ncbi:MAG: hypothetical protein A2Y60_02955 [Chloroflexi bacterium RBG_13_54_9]|nr:MAG: hypothetical protein A2Y60_02955 [Chloroflexi bacterium RBG_13_54_9]
MGAESQNPLSAAAVILCLVTADKKCSLKANLVTTVNEDGSFEIINIPPGSYVVFYGPSGKASSGWKDIDGLEMILNLDGLNDPPGSVSFEELKSTFCGGGGMTIKRGTIFEFRGHIVVPMEGGIISEKYGLTMDFPEGKPITVDVQPGKVTQIEIKAWAL